MRWKHCSVFRLVQLIFVPEEAVLSHYPVSTGVYEELDEVCLDPGLAAGAGHPAQRRVLVLVRLGLQPEVDLLSIRLPLQPRILFLHSEYKCSMDLTGFLPTNDSAWK